MKILISDISILTMSKNIDLFIEKGYIYISDGIIRAVGAGGVPPEYQYAELIIDGKGRVAVPGYINMSLSALLYPIRFREVSYPITKKDLEEYYSSLSSNDIYYIASLAFSDLLLNGVTSTVNIDPFIENIVNASLKTGIRVISAPYQLAYDDLDHMISDLNRNYRRWHGYDNNMVMVSATIYTDKYYEELKRSANIDYPIFVYGGRCGSHQSTILVDPIDTQNCNYNLSNVVFTISKLEKWRPKALLGLANDPSWSLNHIYRYLAGMGFSSLDIIASATVWASNSLKINSGVIEPGALSDIVIYKIYEPPGLLIDRSIESISKLLTFDTPPIETVIVGKDIVVDNGELLTVGRDLFSKAINRVKDILR